MRALAVIVLCLVALPSQAEECRTWPQMVERLAGYGQTPVQDALMGWTTGRRLILPNRLTVFVSPTDDQWTIVQQDPTGCTVKFGHGLGWKWLSARRPSE